MELRACQMIIYISLIGVLVLPRLRWRNSGGHGFTAFTCKSSELISLMASLLFIEANTSECGC